MGASETWLGACLVVSLIGVLILTGIGYYFFCNIIKTAIEQFERFNNFMKSVTSDSKDVKAAQTKMRAAQAELKHVFEDRALGLNTAIETLASASKSLEVVALAGTRKARTLPPDHGVTLTEAQVHQPQDPAVLRPSPQSYLSLAQALTVSPQLHAPGVPRRPRLPPRLAGHSARHVHFAAALTQDEEPRVHLRPHGDCADYSVISETTVRPRGGRE